MEKVILSANYLNNKQIDSICNVLTDMYTEKKLSEGIEISKIDIEDFVKKILGCNIVYENIAEEEISKDDYDCMGFIADGIQDFPVRRNGHVEWIVFPKDTIVLDRYLNDPKQLNHKRFVIAHEAGHIIKNRMYGTVKAEYNHAGGTALTTAPAMLKRYSFKEIEANNFAASLLIPEGMIAMLMHKLYGDKQIVKYVDNILDGEDAKNILSMAKIFGVAYSTMYYRLLKLGYIIEGVLETYVEDTVIGDNINGE